MYEPADEITEQFVANTHLYTMNIPVAMIGIDSVSLGLDARIALWGRLATDLNPGAAIAELGTDVTLDDLDTTLPRILRGETQGRLVVDAQAA